MFFIKNYFFILNYFLIFLYRFNAPMLKINFKQNIILIYFQAKSTLKSNFYHALKKYFKHSSLSN
jgi:hypothetical protein